MAVEKKLGQNTLKPEDFPSDIKAVFLHFESYYEGTPKETAGIDFDNIQENSPSLLDPLTEARNHVVSRKFKKARQTSFAYTQITGIVDNLKSHISVFKYKSALDGQWGITVISESHNLVGESSNIGKILSHGAAVSLPDSMIKPLIVRHVQHPSSTPDTPKK